MIYTKNDNVGHGMEEYMANRPHRRGVQQVWMNDTIEYFMLGVTIPAGRMLKFVRAHRGTVT